MIIRIEFHPEPKDPYYILTKYSSLVKIDSSRAPQNWCNLEIFYFKKLVSVKLVEFSVNILEGHEFDHHNTKLWNESCEFNVALRLIIVFFLILKKSWIMFKYISTYIFVKLALRRRLTINCFCISTENESLNFYVIFLSQIFLHKQNSITLYTLILKSRGLNLFLRYLRIFKPKYILE